MQLLQHVWAHFEKYYRKKPKQEQAQISKCQEEEHLFCTYQKAQTFKDEV